MKIKELLESLSEVKRFISKIMVDGYHFESFDDFPGVSGLKNDLEVESWKVCFYEYKVILLIQTEEPENEDSVEKEEEDSVEKEEEDSVEKLTVGDVLSNIHFDDENTIVIFDRTDSKVYDSDEDDVFVLCELLCLDIKEYVQIHRGKHQIIEIHLKSY